MKKAIRRLLFWTPRILCLLFAAFISTFAADAFGEGRGFWNTTMLLLVHLVPTGILLAILAVSWHCEWVGGILLVGLGIYYIATNMNHIDWCVTIGGPPILTGVFFLINWHYRKELRTST